MSVTFLRVAAVRMDRFHCSIPCLYLTVVDMLSEPVEGELGNTSVGSFMMVLAELGCNLGISKSGSITLD